MSMLQGAERMVLQAIRDAQGDFVEDWQIARTTQIALMDVKDWLQILEGKECIDVARTTVGLSASIKAKGNLVLSQFRRFDTNNEAEAQLLARLRELREKIIVASSSRELRRALYEIEAYLANDPHSPDARLLRDTILGAIRSAEPGAPRMEPAPAPVHFFILPFSQNPDFMGRDDDLARLHAIIASPGQGPIGIRPAGLTGMGGIGKTQLAVEYVYQHKDNFPGGIFWIDAAGPLAEGFARLATDSRLRWAESNRPRDEQIRAAFGGLNRRNALLVLDNLPDPAALAVPVVPDCVPEDLQCRLLFTTRRRDLGRFVGVEVTVLPEDAALRLLLRHPSRRAALDSSHADHEHARAIARMLGRLPLVLELAGAYLGKFSRDVSLAAYREGLKSDGALATLDLDAAELTEADLRRVHAPAVEATIGEQWRALRDDSARLLLWVTALFPESAAVPIPRLGVLAGLGDEARPGRLSPLRRAVKRLEDACLVERLEGDQVRLHPLIREFAARQMPPDVIEDFRRQCLERAADFPTLERIYGQRGVDALQEDLIAILGLCPPSASTSVLDFRPCSACFSARLTSFAAWIPRTSPCCLSSRSATGPSCWGSRRCNRERNAGLRPWASPMLCCSGELAGSLRPWFAPSPATAVG